MAPLDKCLIANVVNISENTILNSLSLWCYLSISPIRKSPIYPYQSWIKIMLWCAIESGLYICNDKHYMNDISNSIYQFFNGESIIRKYLLDRETFFLLIILISYCSNMNSEYFFNSEMGNELNHQ